jgi:hypothetical protein
MFPIGYRTRRTNVKAQPTQEFDLLYTLYYISSTKVILNLETINVCKSLRSLIRELSVATTAVRTFFSSSPNTGQEAGSQLEIDFWGEF